MLKSRLHEKIKELDNKLSMLDTDKDDPEINKLKEDLSDLQDKKDAAIREISEKLTMFVKRTRHLLRRGFSLEEVFSDSGVISLLEEAHRIATINDIN